MVPLPNRGNSQYVTDYRTEKTGIQPIHLGAGTDKCLYVRTRYSLPDIVAPRFEDVQRHVASLIKGKILVGYALWKVLSVSHEANVRKQAC